MDIVILHKIAFIVLGIIFIVANYIIILSSIHIYKYKNLTESLEDEKLFNNLYLLDNVKKKMWFLDFGATTSPIVGLFGTIMALIVSFHSLSNSGAEVSRISSSIGDALEATAIGICVSFWCYLFYRFLSAELKNIESHIKLKALEVAFSE